MGAFTDLGKQTLLLLVPKSLRPRPYLLRLTREQTGCRVRAGVFAGMVYVESAVGSAYLPKLIGIYERELAPCVEEICARKPTLIIDIGAAEGYYAVGLALRNSQAHVIAFEMEAAGRQLLAEMASINGMSERIEVKGRCEAQDLMEALAGANDPVIICDVEGYERELLDPSALPALRRAWILVELHDFIHNGITEELQARFAPTHQIVHIWEEPRSRAEFPWRTWRTRLMPSSFLDGAVSEQRPCQMSWLWMKPLVDQST